MQRPNSAYGRTYVANKMSHCLTDSPIYLHFHVNLEYRLNREMEEKWIVRVRPEVNNPPLHVAVPNSS